MYQDEGRSHRLRVPMIAAVLALLVALAVVVQFSASPSSDTAKASGATRTPGTPAVNYATTIATQHVDLNSTVVPSTEEATLIITPLPSSTP
jgi:hypothetical protein